MANEIKVMTLIQIYTALLGLKSVILNWVAIRSLQLRIIMHVENSVYTNKKALQLPLKGFP